jgi:serine/threonine-protein kinase
MRLGGRGPGTGRAAAPDEGARFGGYVVRGRIGAGAVGTVDRASALGPAGFRRDVALKRPHRHHAGDPEVIAAFVAEAKLAALLEHRHLVQIVELGRVGATDFLAMELVDGPDLHALLRRANRAGRPAPLGASLALIVQLLDVLDHVHRATVHGRPLGVVHGDVSPANVLVAPSGHLKLIDFGSAHTAADGPRPVARARGTLPYRAPEALRGGGDARADVFAAAALAHELLTARPLFAARDDAGTIERLRRLDPPPIGARHPQVPAEIEAIVRQGLARDPAARPASAGAMRDALADVAHRLGLPTSSREVRAYLRAEASRPPAPPVVPPLGAPRPALALAHVVRRRPTSFSNAPALARGSALPGPSREVDFDDERTRVRWTGPPPAEQPTTPVARPPEDTVGRAFALHLAELPTALLARPGALGPDDRPTVPAYVAPSPPAAPPIAAPTDAARRARIRAALVLLAVVALLALIRWA